MKKTYAIEVDCANCANLMEEAAKKTEGVADATVNFMTQKMIVEFAEGADEKKTMKAVLKACKKIEPDCEIELYDRSGCSGHPAHAAARPVLSYWNRRS